MTKHHQDLLYIYENTKHKYVYLNFFPQIYMLS